MVRIGPDELMWPASQLTWGCRLTTGHGLMHTLQGIEDILCFSQPAVRDLAWALRIPPLLAPRGTGVQWLGVGWCERAYLAYRERLQQLDHDPTPLLTHLQNEHDRRLGNYFESLLAFWLDDPANTLYALVARHVAIRDHGLTLGELDFLVRDRASGRFQHWEVAVKFYLGTDTGGDHHHWLGPGLGDRLDLKVSHLLQHQLPLLDHPLTRDTLRDLGISSCENVCLLKGRLFYPWGVTLADWQPLTATPSHWSGWWMPATQFPDRFADADLRWQRLPKEHWLTPLTPDVRIGDTASAAGILELIGPDFDNRAVAIVGTRDGVELERGFLTPPGWPRLSNSTNKSNV